LTHHNFWRKSHILESFITRHHDTILLWTLGTLKAKAWNIRIGENSAQYSLFFEHQALSASPICATQSQEPDVLLLLPNHALLLWTFAYGSSPCQMPHNFQITIDESSTKTSKRRRSSDFDGKGFVSPSRTSRIIKIQDSVHRSVNFVLSNGLLCRARLDFTPKSELVKRCLYAIRMRVPVEKESILVRRFWEACFGPSSKNISVKKEFGIFTSNLMRMVEKRLIPSRTKTHQNTAWNRLCSSGICASLPKAVSDKFSAQTDNQSIFLDLNVGGSSETRFTEDDLIQILQALHLVSESLLLNPNIQEGPQLRKLLISIASICKAKAYLNYYHVFGEDVGQIACLTGIDTSIIPFCLFSWLDKCLENRAAPQLPPFTLFAKKFAPEFFFVMQVYSELFKDGPKAMVEFIAQSEWTLEKIRSLPCGVSLPILENIYSCKRNPPCGLSTQAYKILERDDILKVLESSTEVIFCSFHVVAIN
jgi:hypothetical protein